MRDVEWYLGKMGKLNVDRNNNRYTTGKAPHKPTLLLSLIVLHENGRMNLRNIKPNLYLRDIWSELWKCLDYENPGPIYLPLYHLKSDGFWNVDFRKGIVPNQPKSLSRLMKMVGNISVNDDLLSLIDDRKSRYRLVSALLNGGYYSDEEKKRLIDKMDGLTGSFEYESELIRQVRTKFNLKRVDKRNDIEPKRSHAFRRLVLGAYHETCAVCGMRLETSSGISIIDASHILPFNQFHNDDIRNGLALCKIHHWLFDQGILSIDDHYRILISDKIEEEKPKKVITGLDKEDVILPNSRDYFPHPTALEWHRKNVFEY